MKHSTPIGAKLRLLFAFFVFGSIGLFVRLIPLPSSVIANARGVVGALFLLLVLKLRGKQLHRDAIRRNFKYLLPCGIMLGFNWIALFEAYRYTTVAVATVCYYLAPVFVLLLSPLVLREHLTGRRFAFALVALAGMVLTSGVVQNGFGGSFTGVLLGVVAAAAYASIVLLSKRLTDISSFDTTIMELGISAVVLLPYNLLTTDLSALSCSISELGLLLTVCIVHTGICYALYFSSLPLLSAQTAALFSYIDPIVAITLSALLLREPMDALTVAGAALVLGSTLLSEILGGRK